jgi:hypothetical protein
VSWYLGLTGIFEVVEGTGKDLHRASEVQKIELVVQDHKNINGLIRHRGGLVCSHRDGIELVVEEWARWKVVW